VEKVKSGRASAQSVDCTLLSNPLPTEVVDNCPSGRSSGLASSSPVLPDPAISGDYGVVSITAAGAAGDFHPLPCRNSVRRNRMDYSSRCAIITVMLSLNALYRSREIKTGSVYRDVNNNLLRYNNLLLTPLIKALCSLDSDDYYAIFE
jgi:hypothetical protein